MKKQVVVGILMNAENQVFIAQRSASGTYPLKWEFPGGKVEEKKPSKKLSKENCMKNWNAKSILHLNSFIAMISSMMMVGHFQCDSISSDANFQRLNHLCGKR